MNAVVLAVVLFATVIYADVARFPRLGKCLDAEGNEHPLKEEFDNKYDTFCQKCTCHKNEDVCISNTKFPIDIHTTCQGVFDKETCTYSVVKVADPTVECPFPHKIAGEN